MLGVGPALVVEIVKEASEGPGVLVAAKLACVGAYARFDGERVFAKAFALRVFAEKIPGVVSIWHWFSCESY
jgi:hypothetical protein